MISTRKLRRAIKTGDTKQLAEILREDPKGQIRIFNGWTPLHVAVKSVNKDVVAAILETGAQVNVTTEMHQTPLDLAIKLGNKVIAGMLQKKGAQSGSALSLHPAAGAGDIKAVRKHVVAGADINQLVNDELPLGIALEYPRAINSSTAMGIATQCAVHSG